MCHRLRIGINTHALRWKCSRSCWGCHGPHGSIGGWCIRPGSRDVLQQEIATRFITGCGWQWGRLKAYILCQLRFQDVKLRILCQVSESRDGCQVHSWPGLHRWHKTDAWVRCVHTVSSQVWKALNHKWWHLESCMHVRHFGREPQRSHLIWLVIRIDTAGKQANNIPYIPFIIGCSFSTFIGL
jgi:hypothetical protein